MKCVVGVASCSDSASLGYGSMLHQAEGGGYAVHHE